MNHSDAFREAIAAAGLTPPDEIIGDGKLYRFSSNGRQKDKAGWYVFHDDERPAGRFGCKRSDIDVTWSAKSTKEFTPEEKAAWKKKMQDASAQREADRKRDTEYAAAEAAEMWAAAKPGPHDYLTKKKITGPGSRVLDGMLLIPVRQSATELVGLQRIYQDGSKFFLKGTPIAGGYTSIGKPGPVVVIAEGYATAVSIHMATGYLVVVAFNAGNLKQVAVKTRAKFPDATFIIAADDDAWTDGNPGLSSANDAARASGAMVAVPHWYGDRAEGRTDFNDLHADEGLSAVADCFHNAGEPEPEPGKGGATAPVKQATKPVSGGGAPKPENTGSVASGFVPLPEGVAVQEPGPVMVPEPGSDVAKEVVPRYMAAQRYGLEASEKGIYPTVANIRRVILMDPNLEQTIWFDEFMGRVMTIWRGSEPREWSDVDDINLQIYLQESLGLQKLGKNTVADAVVAAANEDVRNEAEAYINGLKWDGVERLPAFMASVFGTDDNEYTRAAGQNFWVSMVARVLRPGCKVDTMIVLEGIQGAGKSRALSIIGGQWFAEAHQSPTDKDFYLNLAGKMLIEIGEMDAFSRSEVTKVKQVITCQTDRYRAPYERRAADHPRRCVFAGTTNRDDWNKDETGARRFWPVYCTSIDHALLQANRDQYFAEAAHKLSTGCDWWTMPEIATKQQQEARRDSDELEAVLADWLLGRNEVSVHAIMSDMMGVPLERQDKSLQMRIGKALRALKWSKPAVPVWRGGKLARVWRRPAGENGEPV